jgi:N-acetylglucosamine-6-phosphate deacetylase
MLFPGLADLQVNGYKGIGFSSPDLTEQQFLNTCRLLLREGCSAFLPTLVTSPVEVYKRNLPIIASVLGSQEFHGTIPGIHLEGPFISPEDGARGAHNRAWVRTADQQLLDELCEWSHNTVRLITVAAENAGIGDLIRHARRRGITVSIGHSLYNERNLAGAVDAGATALTHLGNALPHLINRHNNPVWEGCANDSLTAMMITDGHHLPPPVIKTILRAKGVERCAVVSDASTLSGMPSGKYESMGHTVIIDQSGKCYNPETGFLVGSSATMIGCMNYLASLKLLSAEELARIGFFNPLKIIGIQPETIHPVSFCEYDESLCKFTLKKG